MKKIAILGATSQIARDLIVSILTTEGNHLHLFARRPSEVKSWLDSIGKASHFQIDEFSEFAKHEFDAVINFVGVGNPAQAVAMGNTIFEVTLRFDEMVLEYLHTHRSCRYLFLSSGAAYGSSFFEPANIETKATVSVNNLAPNEWYGVAKLHAECRHRAHPELAIFDIRVFNYFSHSQDLEARFLITDILRSIRDKTTLRTSPEHIVRDYLHPSDFYQLVHSLLSAPETNAVIDCYSLAPIDKLTLLASMHDQFGLTYELTVENTAVNSTGTKPYYYSTNKRAADFGYSPKLSSLNGLMREAKIIIGNINFRNYPKQ
jgi:nucleoside-diphosphate-sugar epimerase